MIDWALARQIARWSAGNKPALDLGVDLEKMVNEAEGYIENYTSLRPLTPIPAPEVVSPREWTEINLNMMESLMSPVEQKLAEKIKAKLEEKAAKEKNSTKAQSPLVKALMEHGASLILTAEIGLMVSFLSQRVLGQVEVSFVNPEAPTRLLFIGPNLEGAIENMDVEREAFIHWVVFHEMTHIYQFHGVTWLRPHLSHLMREYMSSVEVRLEGGGGNILSMLPSLNPARLIEDFKEAGLIGLMQTPEQREVLQKITGVMSLLEGYSELVMDKAAEELLPQVPELRDKMQKRRSEQSPAQKLLFKFLGFEMKMKQYEEGRAFCDEVISARDMPFLSKVWDRPENLPSAEEIRMPHSWIRRMESGEF